MAPILLRKNAVIKLISYLLSIVNCGASIFTDKMTNKIIIIAVIITVIIIIIIILEASVNIGRIRFS